MRNKLHTLREGLGTWRKYESHLGEWQEALADIITALPETVRNTGL
ncbi:MAG: hypothetical protein GY732_15660 [Gammaproteobacteria bacterium]|nr:hypothetical protein [Gammaproteobacteria bacterium]